MVSRYTLMLFEHDAEMDPDSIGEWVKHEDYAALQTAFREALLAWECFAEALKDNPNWKEAMPRIDTLRAQFLNDK